MPISIGRQAAHIPALACAAAIILNPANLFFASEPAVSGHDIHDLDPLVVNATLAPRSVRDMLNPATVLTSEELDRRLGATIGQTLQGQPGVHAAGYGAGSSRPVIRGFEGGRLRIMESGVDSGDLSADSPDHAVAVEPFFVERIEILRGASTLLYGSQAIGGVVNIIDRRIPRQHPGEQAHTDLATEFNSVAEGWTVAGLATLPVRNFAVTLSYLDRDHGDYAIPGSAELDSEHVEEAPHEDEEDHDTGELPYSFVTSRSASAGISWFAGNRTRISLAITDTNSRYGVPGHSHEEHGEEEIPDGEHPEEEAGGVSIDLDQTAADLEVAWQVRGLWIQAIEGRMRAVRYEHRELEGDSVGTRFERDSLEARITVPYLFGDSAPGSIGTQFMTVEAAAAGEEAQTPGSETEDAAVFLLQEWERDRLRIEGGARVEYRDIAAVGTRGYSDWAVSSSLGARWMARGGWSVGLLFNRAQRHPSPTELFVEGPHAATRQFEIGDPGLDKEHADGLDLSLHYSSSRFDASLTAFHTDFSRFIHSVPTGEVRAGLPVYRYTQVNVVFRGFEMEAVWHAWHAEKTFLDLGLMLDRVDTRIKGSVDNLPRIPPTRAGLRVVWGTGTWSLRSSVKRSFSQKDIGPFEFPGEAYTELGAALTINLPARKGHWRLVLSGENLLDEEIRPHTSPIKDVAPAPGRNLRVHLAVGF